MTGHRGAPLSLADQAGLVILEKLYLKAHRQEKDYTVIWLPSLNVDGSKFEENLNLTEVDPTEVILKYTAKLEEENKSRGKSKKKEREKAGTNKGRSRPELCSRPGHAEERLLDGIPSGASQEEYIRYRKCLYVDTFRTWKEQLISTLSPPAIDHLLGLLTNMYRRKNRELNDYGIFTLQTLLFTEYTSSFFINSSSFYRNFKSPMIQIGLGVIDHRIGPTILRSCLMEGHRLTQLALERVCTDTLLELVGRVATNLKYLNISLSFVTDRGLFDLVGIKTESAASRPRLARSCKKRPLHSDDRVKNVPPRWTKIPGKGAVNLVHVEANSLNRLEWHLNGVSRYIDYQNVPLDAGFVALVTFLPKLKILKTEVAGRAVLSYVRGKQSNKKFIIEPLELEVIFESRPNAVILDCLAQYCPKLRAIHVEWYDAHSVHLSVTEDWLPYLKKFPKLTHFQTSDIDYKTNHLRDILPVMGQNLVNLHLQEIWSFRYSLTKQVKECCPNLVKYCLLMRSNSYIAPIQQILVERDVDLCLETSNRRNSRKLFSQLRELHLIGPLCCDFVRYAVLGCDKLRSLTLGIEWPDPAFCNVGPESRKDLLGREFLDEVRGVNSLADLEEIHFITQYKRGSSRLNRDFALYVASEFKKLKHFGTFKYWNLEPADIKEIIGVIRQTNKAISFDEDYMDLTRTESLKKIVREDRAQVACSWLPLRAQNLFLIDEVTELLVGPGVIWADEDIEEDDEDQDLSEDDSLNSSDDEDMLDGGPHGMALLDPCVIQ